ncbi:MAG TPA: hypothetical protein VGK94_09580 [Candidatus Polarisedimenticolia bacterium]|jgi:hypothetical protein
MVKWSTTVLAAALAAFVPALAAESPPEEVPPAPDSASQAVPPEDPPFDPYFLGWESEPTMDYGGRDVTSLHLGLCRAIGTMAHAGRRPMLAAAWEVPFGLFLSVVQHEVMGHGGRAREFHLRPSYGAGLDFSFYTTIDKDPQSNEVTTLIAAGGTEADNILARRLLLDLYRPDGAEGAVVPLLIMAKIDLTLYALQTEKPDRHDRDRQKDFQDQFEEGNDMAYWIVGRQAQRVGADPTMVWEQDYNIDFSDTRVLDTWRDMRATALWNFLDPAVGASVYSWLSDHLRKGSPRIRPPVLRLGGGWGLTAATRGYLGPAEVSRFLDILATTPIGTMGAYLRDLDSADDRTYGWGFGLHRVRLARFMQMNLQGDSWREPEAIERASNGSRWNGSAEVEFLFADRWGFSAKGGYKKEGFYPGTPMDRGTYLGFGLRGSF